MRTLLNALSIATALAGIAAFMNASGLASWAGPAITLKAQTCAAMTWNRYVLQTAENAMPGLTHAHGAEPLLLAGEAREKMTQDTPEQFP
ncbi:MAG: hypothetical protein ACKVQA_06720 [Burkholderiales bacterium]